MENELIVVQTVAPDDAQDGTMEAALDVRQDQEQIIVQTNVQPNAENGENGTNLFPLILAGIVVLIALIAVITFMVVRRKEQSDSDFMDEEQSETERFVRAENAETATQEVRTEDLSLRTQARDNTLFFEKTELPMKEISVPNSLKEVEMPRTEIINQHTDHPKFAIGRCATIGGREEQQDSFYCSNWTDDEILSQRGLLVAVADGIGGLKDGALASSTVMAAMQNRFASNTFASKGSNKLLSLVAAAQSEALRLNQSGHHCGCTLVAVLIEGWDLHLASVGDSRIYLYRAGGLITLNREHTLRRENEDQAEFARMSVSPDNLRKPKAITSYMGKANIRLIDRTIQPMKLLPGDKVLLMSDGVFGTLSEDEMINSLRKAPDIAAKEMIDSIDARMDPRQDNATVVIIAVQ